VRDDDECAVPARERQLELLDRLEVEVVRRLVEDEQIDACRLQLREVRPVRSPGESVSHGAGRARRRARTSPAVSARPRRACRLDL
jgi:hypothetical protein